MFGSFFSGIGDFFGGLFGGRDEEEEKRRSQPTQTSTSAPRSSSTSTTPSVIQAPDAQEDKDTGKFKLPTVQKPNFTIEQLAAARANPNAPYSPELLEAAKNSPWAKTEEQRVNEKIAEGKQRFADRVESQKRIDDFYRVSGKVPVLAEGVNMGTGLAASVGALTGDTDLVDRANRARTLTQLEMTPEELAAVEDKDLRNRLNTINDFSLAASPALAGLNLLGARGAGAFADDIARTGATRGTLPAVGTFAKGMGANAAIGGTVTAGLGTGINNYVNTGNPINFSDFNAADIPRLFATGALYSMALPENPLRNSTRAASQNIKRARLKFAREAEDLSVEATKPDTELGSISDGIASRNIANAERDALETAADQSRTAANTLDEADQQLTRVAPTTPEQTGREVFTPPVLQAVDQRPKTVPLEAVPEAQVVKQADEMVETPPVQEQVLEPDVTAPEQLAPAPVDAPIETVTPSGTAVRGQTLETAANTKARQAADEIAPVDPESVPRQLGDAEARTQAMTPEQELKALAQEYDQLGDRMTPEQADRILTRAKELEDSIESGKAMSVEQNPADAIKAEAKRFGYDKGYTEEGQIANTIDELMKEQNAVREVGIPLYDKYKGQLDGTKTVTELMTPSELKAYKAAEAKSDKASKLLKDYFDYKKQGKATSVDPTTPQPKSVPVEKTAQTRGSNYRSPEAKGFASVPGNRSVRYSTGDDVLDGLVNDVLIATKGTAKTARTRLDSLVKEGLTGGEIRRIRDIAVRAVDKKSGRISDSAVQTIREILADNQPKLATVGDAPKKLQAVKAQSIDEAVSTSELGKISENAVINKIIKSDADAEKLGARIGDEITREFENIGSDWDTVHQKIQKAWSNKTTNYKDAGLTDAEWDLVKRTQREMNVLRNRIDPAIRRGGDQGQFYAPRQAEGTEFTQEMINEFGRTRNTGLGDAELDYSTAPIAQYIRRYANAQDAVDDMLLGAIKTVEKTNPISGEKTVVDTGVKVTDKMRAAIKDDTAKFVEARDSAIQAADAGDAKAVDEAVKAADDAINSAMNKLIKELRSEGSGDVNRAAEALKELRRPYVQSYIRTNMFLNIANRAFDQVQKAVVGTTNQAMPLALKVAQKITRSKTNATNLASVRIAKQQAKGGLRKELNRNIKTTVSLAGAGRNPVLKAIAKADASFRGAGTYITSLGDMTTTAEKMTNLSILADAQNKGIFGKADLEAYLVKAKETPEYRARFDNISNLYAGYIGMPQTLTSSGMKGSKFAGALSRVDNVLANTLRRMNVPEEVAKNVNDAIMPSITGFAGATARIGGKTLNAMALGLPNIYRGAKLAASGAPDARIVGEMMIARSLIDGVVAGGMIAPGLMLGASGNWTGSYPSDKKEAARWRDQGIVPESFRLDVGDSSVYIQPGRVFGAFALPLVLPAVVADSIKDGTDPADAIGQVVRGSVGQFISNMGADAILTNIDTFNKLMSTNKYEQEQAKQRLMQMVGFNISNTVPAAGALNNVANFTDEYQRDTSGGIGDVIKARNPFTRDDVPEKLDSNGEPLPNNRQFSGGSYAVTVGQGQSKEAQKSLDGVTQEINRLAEVGFEVTPTGNAKNNKDARKWGEILLETDFYKNADDERKGKMMNDTLLGTKFKDINENLEPQYQKALVEAEFMDGGEKTGERGKWLEDAGNARDYYNAKYQNAIENDTLSASDDDLQSMSSLHHKAVRASVNATLSYWTPTLEEAYENTSKSEFEDMEDTQLKRNLMALDKARAEAGVSRKDSDKSKRKYANKDGAYGKKGRSGGRGARQTVNLTKLDVKSPASGSQLKALEYSGNGGRKQMPTIAKSKPKGRRRISVKKGVSL